MDQKNSQDFLVKSLYKCRKDIYAWVKSNSGSRQDAEDVLQESILIYLKLWETGRLYNTENPKSLLLVISKRYWLGLIRKRKNTYISLESIDLTDDLISDIDSAIDNENKMKASELALNQLGEKCRALLKLFYYDKLNLTEIAGKLGFRNEHVARSMKFKCLEKARHLVKNHK